MVGDTHCESLDASVANSVFMTDGKILMTARMRDNE